MLDLLAGMGKRKEWRDFQTQGARCLEIESVRSLFQANVFKRGVNAFDYEALEFKAIALLMIVNHLTRIVRWNKDI